MIGPGRLPAFITFEGGEGVGKSTQVRLLRDRLEELNVPVLTTREPGGSPRAEAIRTFLLAGEAAPLGTAAEAILFAAARADHVDETIRPALERGMTVICDRFTDSTRAYQGALGQVPDALLTALEIVTVDDIRPDLTLMLDVPTAIGLARAAARRQQGEVADRFEREQQAFHERLREAFLEIAANNQDRCVVVDATAEETIVARAIWAIVVDRFGLSKPAAAEEGLIG